MRKKLPRELILRQLEQELLKKRKLHDKRLHDDFLRGQIHGLIIAIDIFNGDYMLGFAAKELGLYE